MFYHDIDPVFLKVWIFELRYYGLLYALGFLLSYFILKHLAKERKLELNEDDIDTYIILNIFGVVLGARIIYVLFYNISFYIQNPLEIIFVWHGGLSFHGGLLGAVLATFYFCRKKKISFYKLADIMVIPAALALGLGRIGNFMNGELYGRITNVPWAVKFRDAEGFRHPSQIYESLKNFFIFGVLFFIRKKQLKDGIMFWLFITLYSFFRFSIEFIREPDPQLGLFFGFLTMGQLLTFPLFIIGIYMIYRIKKD